MVFLFAFHILKLDQFLEIESFSLSFEESESSRFLETGESMNSTSLVSKLVQLSYLDKKTGTLDQSLQTHLTRFNMTHSSFNQNVSKKSILLVFLLQRQKQQLLQNIMIMIISHYSRLMNRFLPISHYYKDIEEALYDSF